jgi:hypothetical protein
VLLRRVLRPRQDRCIRRLDVIGAAPATSTAKAPTTDLSGLNSTALELAVYASCRRLLGAARNTRFRLLASSAGWDWLPTGFQRKVSALYPYIASPFPKLGLAQGRSSFRKTRTKHFACSKAKGLISPRFISAPSRIRHLACPRQCDRGFSCAPLRGDLWAIN